MQCTGTADRLMLQRNVSLESGDTRQCLLAAGTIMYYILAVSNAEGNEATSQQEAPENITTECYS